MIKLYLDEDVHKKIATILSAHEVRHQGFADCQQLEYAVSAQRAIFTFNVGDFDKLHKKYLKEDTGHFGILLSKQIPIGETVSRLTKFLFAHSAEEIKNNIFWI